MIYFLLFIISVIIDDLGFKIPRLFISKVVSKSICLKDWNFFILLFIVIVVIIIVIVIVFLVVFFHIEVVGLGIPLSEITFVSVRIGIVVIIISVIIIIVIIILIGSILIVISSRVILSPIQILRTLNNNMSGLSAIITSTLSRVRTSSSIYFSKMIYYCKVNLHSLELFS